MGGVLIGGSGSGLILKVDKGRISGKKGSIYTLRKGEMLRADE